MTKFALPVSTTQAIVGAIIGWNLFTGNHTDSKTLTQIVATWISGPILGGLFAIILYISLKKIKRSAQIHLVIFESYIKTGLIIVGAFGAYSLGANNIANVMGVFLPAFDLEDLNLGIITLNSAQQLFLLGGIAIALGIFTYSKRVMETIGGNIVELSSEAALVVVLAQAFVLFIFSSSGLSNLFVKAGLPPIPMVPISSSQVIVGCVLGIGLYKGARNINFKILGQIALGWLATPIASGLLSFFSLFFIKNIFSINVGSKITDPVNLSLQITNSAIYGGAEISGIIRYLLLGFLIFGAAGAAYYLLLERKKRKEMQKSEEKFWRNMK
jgi:PiT family inorganic phosphate transporter